MVALLAFLPLTLLTLPNVKTEVVVIPCGYQNAFYVPAKKQIMLCMEDRLLPAGVVRYLIAHEIGHAVISQLNLPITGSEEAAADEFAAVALAEIGHEMDVAATALWYASQESEELVNDDHQSEAKRAAVLSCLADGASDSPHIKRCGVKFKKAEETWWRLVTAFSDSLPE